MSAMAGVESANTEIIEHLPEIGKAMASYGSDLASDVATYANGVTIAATLTGDFPVAATAATVALVADGAAFGLSVISQDPEKIAASTISIVLDKAPSLFNSALGAGFDSSISRFRNPETGQLMKNMTGKIIIGFESAAGILTGIAIDKIQGVNK